MDALVNQLAEALKPIVKDAINECLGNKKPDGYEDICYIDEAAKLTGKSKSWLYICWKQIPGAKKHGKRIYFSKKALLNEWIRGNEKS